MSQPTARLWRVRKHSTSIDAQIVERENDGARVDFFYDGDCIVSREFSSRELAVADAERTLRDLERAGWNTHW